METIKGYQFSRKYTCKVQSSRHPRSTGCTLSSSRRAHVGLHPRQQLLPRCCAARQEISLRPSLAITTFTTSPCGKRTLFNQRLISASVQFSGSPLGSSSRGNMSLPQMDQAVAAPTSAAKPTNRF